MARWGMVIDLDKCTACQACVVACRAENNVFFAGPEQTQKGRAKFWMEVLRLLEGQYPKVTAQFTPRPCQQCENPPCVQVCPVGATYKRGDGIVAQDYDRCIGCRYCMVACPYGVRFFNWSRQDVPEPLAQQRNPDVPLSPVGVVEKCTFCVQRIERGEREGKKIGSDGEVVTACTQTCPASAIYFGDLDDTNSTVHRLAHSRRAFRLLEELGTAPQVYYLAGG